jgi:hypothetical protein
VTRTLAMLAGHARTLDPDVQVSVNDFDAVMRPSYVVYGIDLRSLAGVQDVMMIEDYGLPRWEEEPGTSPLLVNNALTLRTARALIGDTPLSTNPYDKGIGFDGVYAPRRFVQGLAEAAACGAMMVVKGTEYVEEGVFTLLTADRFAPQREAIGQFHRWLAEHPDLFHGRESAALVGLLYPDEALWHEWDRLAPLYFGVGQTLLAAGIPWKVVTPQDDWSGLRVLFCFDGMPVSDAARPRPRIVSVPQLSGWNPPPPSYLARHKAARRPVSKGVSWLFQSYFRSRGVRRLVDSLGLVHFFWQAPFFRLPPAAARESALAALGEPPFPRVTSAAPVLVEPWLKGDRWQLHLVNYAAQAQSVKVEFGQPVSGRLLTPDKDGQTESESTFGGSVFECTLDVYAVLEYQTGCTDEDPEPSPRRK